MATVNKPPKIDQRHNDYTSHSANYDQKRFAGRNNEYLESLRCRAVHKALDGIGRDRRILDVGCGTGRGIRYLVTAGFRQIAGMDYTAAMLAQAQRNTAVLDEACGVQFLRGDAFSLPCADDSFDAVISLNFLHMFHLGLQRQLLAEMTRVCRPGGRLVLEFENIHKGLFVTRYLEQRQLRHRTKFNSLREIRALFSRSSFSSVRVYGTALPKVYRLFSRCPRFGAAVESVTLAPPFNWLAERVIVAADQTQATGVERQNGS